MGYPLLAHMLELRAYPDEWASDYSDEIKVEAAQDEIAPLAPSDFAISSIAQGIELTWKNPTLNFDGTTCRDLAWIAVYRSTTAGIDPDDPASYDERKLVQGESYIFNSTNTSQTYYFVVTAMDRTGNESDPTSELSAAPGPVPPQATVIPDDATGLIFDDSIGGDGVVSGDGILGIAFKEPSSSWVNFDRYRLWYQYTTDGGTTWRDEDGTAGAWTEIGPVGRWGFMHKGLDSTGAKAYRYKATIVSTDGIESTTPDTAGGATTTADASDNSALVAITIFAMNIVALGEVRAENIKVTNLSAINADLGAVTAGSIVVGDSTNKLWLNDAGDGGLAIGGTDKATAPFRVTAAGALTATSATITGELHTGSGSVINGAYIDSLSASKLAAGDITVGLNVNTGGSIKSNNYSAGSTGWKINYDGSAEFQNATIRGSLNASDITAGTLDFSAISRNGLAVLNSELNGGITHDKISSVNADTITVGTLTGRKIQTSSSGARLVMNDTGFADMLVGYDSSGTQKLLLSGTGTIQATSLDSNGSSAICTLGSGVIGRFSYSGSTVYNSTAPTSWTNLDLSSYVGARRALVLLRIYNGSSNATNYRFRPDGSSEEQGVAVDNWPGALSTRIETSYRYNYVWCMTGTNGYVEWAADLASSTTIVLLAYIS